MVWGNAPRTESARRGHEREQIARERGCSPHAFVCSSSWAEQHAALCRPSPASLGSWLDAVATA